MVASSVLPRREIPGFVEDVMAAGVRFIYFSPRNMRRTKALAEKMGIETDWNCAISLRPLKSEEKDQHRMITNYGDWDVKARLPHGIKAIRQHLANVDNVPLLVSLFTDSTPSTINDMFGVFHDYHESVLCVGCAFRSTNARLFRRADLSVSIEGLPGMNKISSLPNRHPGRLSSCDAMFNEDVISLFCAFSLRHGVKGYEKKVSMAILIDLIREGRRALCNVYQIIFMTIMILFTSALVLVVGTCVPAPQMIPLDGYAIIWIVWVVVPMLTLPFLDAPSDANVLTRCPRKNVIKVSSWVQTVLETSHSVLVLNEFNGAFQVVERGRAFKYLLQRSLLIVLTCIFVYIRSLACMILGTHIIEVNEGFPFIPWPTLLEVVITILYGLFAMA